MAFLEASVIWSGSVSLDDLRAAFGITRAQAQEDIARYGQHAPGNLVPGAAAGAYGASERFEAQFLRGSAQEFLQVLRNHAMTPDLPLAVVAAGVAPVEVLELPQREFEVRVLQRVTAAIRERRWLEVQYQSLSHPEPRRLEIAPHSLAFAGRWHVRAFSREHGACRDFRLSRISGTPGLLAGGAPGADEDWDWRNFVNVKVGAHPGLAAVQRRVVEADYGMQNGVLQKAVRVALVPYYLRLLGVGRDDTARPAAEQQIVLLNPSELEVYTRLS